MARVQEAVFENLTPEQQRVYKAIAGPRLTFGGPWNVWIKNPELAETLNKIGDILRVHGKLPKRLQELMILVIARQWDCDYMWFVHEEDAVKQGLTKETVDAIRNYQTPVLVKEDEKVDVTTSRRSWSARTRSWRPAANARCSIPRRQRAAAASRHRKEK